MPHLSLLAKRILKGLTSKWMMLVVCMNSIPWMICLMKTWHFSSVRWKSGADSLSNRSPPVIGNVVTFCSQRKVLDLAGYSRTWQILGDQDCVKLTLIHLNEGDHLVTSPQLHQDLHLSLGSFSAGFQILCRIENLVLLSELFDAENTAESSTRNLILLFILKWK